MNGDVRAMYTIVIDRVSAMGYGRNSLLGKEYGRYHLKEGREGAAVARDLRGVTRDVRGHSKIVITV